MQNGDKSFSIEFKQQFQKLTGTAKIDGRHVAIRDGILDGDRISFSIDGGSASP